MIYTVYVYGESHRGGVRYTCEIHTVHCTAVSYSDKCLLRRKKTTIRRKLSLHSSKHKTVLKCTQMCLQTLAK